MIPLKNFKKFEFACKCCGQFKMDDSFLYTLDQAREIAGIPFVINSGYRCPLHNSEVGGKEDSAHTKGVAVDIACNDSTKRYRIVNSLLLAGFKRIGVSGKFIHVDSDAQKPQYVMWLYS